MKFPVVSQSEFTLNRVVISFKVLAFLNEFDSWFDRHHFRWSDMVELNHGLLMRQKLKGAAGFIFVTFFCSLFIIKIVVARFCLKSSNCFIRLQDFVF